MNICCNTDYCGGTGDFISQIYEIAEAGFTHYFWCHQWNTDFLYTAPEIAEIKKTQRAAGLKLLDIHGSKGVEKYWCSTTEYIRKAGVELVKNRIEMLREGLEDYEMLYLLREKLAAAKDLPAEKRAEYEALLTVPPEITSSMTEFSKDPAPIYARRKQIAEAIEMLSASLP